MRSGISRASADAGGSLTIVVAGFIAVGSFVLGRAFVATPRVVWNLAPHADGARVVAAATAIALVILAWRLRARVQAHHVALLLMLAALATVAAGTVRPSELAWSALLPYLIGGAALAAATVARATASDLRPVVVIAAMALALSVIADAVGLWPAAGPQPPGGLLGSRNFAGEYLALSTPACMQLLRRRWRLVAIVVLGAALTLTRCRAGWLAAAVACVVMGIVARRDDRPRLALGVVALALGAVCAAWLPTRLHWSEPAPYATTLSRLVDVRSGSGALRVEQYRVTAALLADDGDWIAGVGAGNWRRAVTRLEPRVALNRVPHSDLLRVASDGGAITLALLLLFAALAFRRIWEQRATSPDGPAFAAATTVICLADALLYRPEAALLVFGWCAALTGPPPQGSRSQQRTKETT